MSANIRKPAMVRVAAAFAHRPARSSWRPIVFVRPMSGLWIRPRVRAHVRASQGG
jgi:hypothetical protein